MFSSEKRSSSTSPQSHSKRVKVDTSVPKWTKASPSPSPVAGSSNLRPPTRGTEFVRLPEQHPSNVIINDLIVETTRGLARIGKRLVHAPRLLTDGIIFDWVLDFSAKEEDVGSILTVKGVDSEVVRSVLSRADGSFQRRRESGHRTPMIIELISDDEDDLDVKANNKGTGGTGDDISHPICIDTDEGPERILAAVIVRPLCNDSQSALARGVEYLAREPFQEASQLAWGDTSAHAIPEDKRSELDRSVRGNASTSVRVSTSPGSEARARARMSQDRPDGSSIQPLPRVSAAPASISTEAGNQVNSNRPRNLEHNGGADKRPRLDYGNFGMLRSSPDGNDDDLSDEDISDDLPRAGLRASLPRAPVNSTVATARSRDVNAACGEPIASTRLNKPSQMSKSSQNSRSSTDESQSSSSERSDLPVSKSRPSIQPFPALRRPPRERGLATKTHFYQSQGRTRVSGDSSDRDSSSESSSSDDSEQPAPSSSSAKRHALRRLHRERNDTQDRQEQHTRARVAHEVVIPKTGFARGRRVLVSSNAKVPLTTIAMRGDASFIDQRKLWRISKYSLPFYIRHDAPNPRVVDACLLEDNTAVLGYDSGPSQVSLILPALHGDQVPRRVDLAHRAHTIVQEKSGIAYPNPGISALSPVEGRELRFLSGGCDKSIHLWTLERNSGDFTARSKRLKILHSQKVNAVAYRAHDRKVFSAAGKFISVVDIASHIAPDPIRVADGAIFQVHIHPQVAHIVILEVDHMDRQILLYDTRTAGFDRAPCLEFGFRDTSTQRKTRYTKGSTCHNYVVRPYGDTEKGVIKMWDYRNAKDVVQCFHSVRPAPIVHAVLSGSDIIAYGGHSVTIWKTNREA